MSLGLLSDYRVRGVSLNDGRPAAQFTLNRDSTWGGYAGLSVAQARLIHTAANAAGVAYAGYATRFGSDGSWDVGGARTVYRGAGEYDYHELHAGAGWGPWTARLSWSPRYFGVQGRSLYAEVQRGGALGEGLELQLHAGRLHAAEGAQYWYGASTRSDARIGVAWMIDRWTLHAAWTGVRGSGYGLPLENGHGWVAGAAFTF